MFSEDTTNALIGGGLIALAASSNLLLNGQITGMSSIFSTIITLKSNAHLHLKFSAFSGLVTSGLLASILIGRSGYIQGFPVTLYDNAVAVTGTASIIGGLLVGFGTRLGNGCTSGHGVCGIPRLSKRSITAVGTFMTVAAITSTLVDKFGFINIQFLENLFASASLPVDQYLNVFAAVINLGLVASWVFYKADVRKQLVSYWTGFLFGSGLILSGMARVSKVKGFLTLNNYWDPSLMFVMAAAVSVNLVTFNAILSRSKPVVGNVFEVPPASSRPDRRLMIGASMFGVGWGLCGVCPGPAIVTSLVAPRGIATLASIAGGMFLFEAYDRSGAKGKIQ